MQATRLLTRRTFLRASAALLATAGSACSRVGELYIDAEPSHAAPAHLTEPLPPPSVAAPVQVPVIPAAPTAPVATVPLVPVEAPGAVTPAPAVAAVPIIDETPWGLVYPELPDPDLSESILPRRVPLPNLVRDAGQPWRLRGRLVEVVNHGVLVERSPTSGEPRGRPMGNAEAATAEGFQFRPCSGGPSPWKNEELEGAENERALEAARFGEVNAYYHADRALAYANELLAELGEPPLPLLRVVVNAHSASRLRGYRRDDGDRSTGTLRSFPGGHYRRPTTVRESAFRHAMDEMHAAGEVHLGIGNGDIKDSRGQPVMVDGHPYTKIVSHIPGIIVHEVGHHIISHTADFRANRERKPNAPSNRKIHLDEGTADYWAAVLLDTPDIFGWQQAARGLEHRENRDLRGPRTTESVERDRDPHRVGNVWSSALWDVRRALGARTTDLLVMKTLVTFGQVRPSVADPADVPRQRVIELKDELRDGLLMLLTATEQLGAGAERATLLEIFKQRRIDPATSDRVYLTAERRDRRS